MIRVRRTGLVVFAVAFITFVGAAFATEGFGVAVIVATVFLIVAAMTIPLLAVFEEERDLPAARASRSGRYPRGHDSD